MAENQDDEYRVGPGNPPKHSRFKPGQSGNPKGRPKGKTNLGAAFEREMMALVNVTEGGKSRRLSKEQMVAKSITNNAIKGDLKSAQLLIQLLCRSKEEAQMNAPEMPEPDADMIKRIRKRLLRRD